MQAAAPAVALLVDIRDGFDYMVRTPWLLGTLVRMPRVRIRGPAPSGANWASRVPLGGIVMLAGLAAVVISIVSSWEYFIDPPGAALGGDLVSMDLSRRS